MMATALGIVKEEGLMKLFQGLSPALYRHLVYSGVRIGTYDYLRKRFVHNSETLTLWRSAVAGVSAGGKELDIFSQFFVLLIKPPSSACTVPRLPSRPR